MALTLSKTNIATGNIITAAEISQSIDAFTGAAAYDITVSGSFTFTGATTGSGWFSRSVSSSYALSSSYAVSSSRALSANTATTAGSATSAGNLSGQEYDAGSGIQTGTFKFVAGKVVLSSGVGSSSIFPQLASKVIGTNAFITVTYADGFTFSNPSEPANLMVSVTGDGRVAVIQESPSSDNGSVIFTGMYV